MMQATKACNHNVKEVGTVNHMFNIREWIVPHLNEIHYHTQPHIFLFKRNESGKAVMLYKQWSNENWQSPDGVSVMLKVSSALNQVLHIYTYMNLYLHTVFLMYS